MRVLPLLTLAAIGVAYVFRNQLAALAYGEKWQAQPSTIATPGGAISSTGAAVLQAAPDLVASASTMKASAVVAVTPKVAAVSKPLVIAKPAPAAVPPALVRRTSYQSPPTQGSRRAVA